MADVNNEKERLLGNPSPHRPKSVHLQTTRATENDQEVAEHLRLQSYAHASPSIQDVQKIGKRAVHPTTDFQTFVHLVKGNLGTGLLALPYAVSKVGYIVGPALMIFLGVIATHCMILLTKSSQVLCKRYDASTLDYGEVAEAAFSDYKFRKKFGSFSFTEVHVSKIAKLIVNLFLIATQFGFCCVYFVFMGDNLKQVFDACGVEFDARVWIGILVPLVAIFCWIKNFDSLAPLATVANLCILFGLGVILFDVIHLMDERKAAVFKHSGVEKAVVSSTALAVFFGNAVYAFEGIGVVLPLENKIKNPHHFSRVVYLAMTSITLLYAGFGTLGYLAFGDNIDDSITLNLPGDKHLHSVVYHIAKLYFSYAIFVTYLVQFYVPMDFLEAPLISQLGAKHEDLKLITFRTTLVIITAGLAVAIPKLDLFISLIGAFASSALAIIFPPILQIMVFCRDPEPCWQKSLWISKSLFIILVGLIGFATGSYVSVKDIITYFRTGK